MVGSCCICKKTYTKEGTVQLFRFPLKNLTKRQNWLNVVEPLGIQPTASSRICNEHFLESDFEARSSNCAVRLKDSAVPSQNLTKVKAMAPRPILPKPLQVIKKEPETILVPKQETVKSQPHYVIDLPHDRKVVCIKDIFSLNQSLKKNTSLPLVGGLSVLKQSMPIIQNVTSLNPAVQKKLTRMPVLVKTVRSEKGSLNDNVKNLKTEVLLSSPPPLLVKKDIVEKKNASVQANLSSSQEVLLKRKLKTLQQKVRRKDKKISCLKELLYALKRKGLLEPDASEMIDHYFDDSD